MDYKKIAEEVREIARRLQDTDGICFIANLETIADELDPPKEPTLAGVLNEHDGRYEWENTSGRVWEATRNKYGDEVVLCGGFVRFRPGEDEEMIDLHNKSIHALSGLIKEKYGESC